MNPASTFKEILGVAASRESAAFLLMPTGEKFHRINSSVGTFHPLERGELIV
jgi:hypothetical protein